MKYSFLTNKLQFIVFCYSHSDDIMKVGAIISNRSEHISISNYSAVKNVGTDISGFTNTGDLITDNVEADLVTTSLSFLLFHLNIDGTAWGPFLSSVFVGSMALLQVNGFPNL